MTDTPKRRSIGSDGGDNDEEREVFFGEVTRKERRQAVKYSRRRTVLYIPGFRKDRSLMRYSEEFTPDGSLIYAHEEEEVSDVCVTESTNSVCKELDVKSQPKEFPPLSDYSSSEEVAKKLFPSKTESANMSVSCTVVSGGECDNRHASFESKFVESSSRLFSDSGVDCGVGDSVLSSSKLSECTTSRIENGITIREKDQKSVLPNLSEDSEPSDDMVFVRPQSRLAHVTQTSTSESAAQTCPPKPDNINPALTNYAGSFLSDSDASDIDGFKRPFRLQGVFNGTESCQTISTPRVASSVPSLSFASPHLLVSPIASYKSSSGKHESDSSSTKSSDSTPSKLVLSSVSAFSRFPATTAIRRSLRNKSDDLSEIVDSVVDSEQETSRINTHLCVGASDANISTTCLKRENIVCSSNQTSDLPQTPPKKPMMVSTSTQSDYLSLPSTLEGQQLLLVKSCELSKGQLESSPESLVSQSSWADLKLSSLGINRERLCLATVSSDSSSFKTQSSDTNATTSSDAQKPDLVTDSELLKRSEVTEEEVLESLDKKLEKDVTTCSPSTEFELGMNSEYFSIGEAESTAPDLCTSHGCDNYVPSDQTQSQTEEENDCEDSDSEMDPSELDTILPEGIHEQTLIENDYSPVKGRSYERQQRRLQQQQRPGLVWPNRYMSDSESSETEDLCEESFDSGSSDSSLLECEPQEDADPISPPSMEAMSVSLNDGKLQPWRPPGYVEAPAKKSSEVKGTKKSSSFRIKGLSSNKENQLGKKYPKSPLPKNEGKSEKDKKKTPSRRKKKSDMVSQMETEIDNMTKLHTLCNGQRVVRYLNFSESPMIIKHYPAPKNPSKLSWNQTLANSDLTHHSPVRSPSKPKPRPILTHRPTNHTYPYSEDVPSPIILTRTRRTNTLSQRVTQL